MSKFFFRCKTNPSAPLLELDTFWEAEEMKDHPDYERIDEAGELVVYEEDSAPNRIPFVTGKKR